MFQNRFCLQMILLPPLTPHFQYNTLYYHPNTYERGRRCSQYRTWELDPPPVLGRELRATMTLANFSKTDLIERPGKEQPKLQTLAL
jgi:hypothetical protein